MKDFILIFRQLSYDRSKTSQKETEVLNKKWHDWIGGIAAQGKLASNGAQLTQEGKVLKASGVLTDGPFVEIREILGGFILIKADNLDDAATLAHGSPALDAGGSVEIRAVFVH